MDNMPPTKPPSTTRGIRTFQTIAQSASLTPVSKSINGSRLTSSSGTRHQSGPAGPIETPMTTANNTNTPPAANQRVSCCSPNIRSTHIVSVTQTATAACWMAAATAA